MWSSTTIQRIAIALSIYLFVLILKLASGFICEKTFCGSISIVNEFWRLGADLCFISLSVFLGYLGVRQEDPTWRTELLFPLLWLCLLYIVSYSLHLSLLGRDIEMSLWLVAYLVSLGAGGVSLALITTLDAPPRRAKDN